MQPITRHVGAFILALALGSFPALSTAVTTPDTGKDARHLWHQNVQAGYQALADQAGEFALAAESYCRAPTTTARDLAQQTWRDAFLAWQTVRFVDFGPVEAENRAWQFQFWPDPKNLVARKASYLLGGGEPITPELIEQSGVAVQGFPMTEYLLFDESLNRGERALPADKTCELLVAVAHHIAGNSKQLRLDWQAFAGPYLASAAYTDTTIRASMKALEVLEDRRLGQPMGLHGSGKRSAYAADAWRSGTSLMAAQATVEGLERHFLPGLSLLLEEAGHPALALRIEAQFNEVLEHFPTLHTPMTRLLADNALFAGLQGFYVDLSQLVVLVNDQAAVELGVVRGFNSSDGD